MKKRNWFWLAMVILILTTNACVKQKYEAYVTIANIGNLTMKVWVDGNQATIAAYESQTWSILLEEENEYVNVLLEAEPLDNSDHDEIIITLHGDRDIQTWLTGWDASAASGRLQKRQSSLLKGALNKELSSFQH